MARTFLVAVLSTAFVAAAPDAAQAGAISNPDAVGDMTEIDYDTGAQTPAPDRVRDDVLNTTLTHGTRRVSIRVEYADLEPIEGAGTALFAQMVTDEGARRYLEFTVSANTAGEALMYRGDDRLMRCAIRESVDYTSNVIRVSFPRACASYPRWVRFRVGSMGFDDDLYFDDALRDGASTDDTVLARSRRVYRSQSA